MLEVIKRSKLNKEVSKYLIVYNLDLQDTAIQIYVTSQGEEKGIMAKRV